VAVEKKTVGNRVNPEKYGMIFCPECHGSGKCFNPAKKVEVCKFCQGFGAIRKERKSTSSDNRGILKLEFITE
jgi:DnaJ-class molecular chaperone